MKFISLSVIIFLAFVIFFPTDAMKMNQAMEPINMPPILRRMSEEITKPTPKPLLPIEPIVRRLLGLHETQAKDQSTSNFFSEKIQQLNNLAESATSLANSLKKTQANLKQFA